ncbi:hypothetical protein ACFQI3_03070 [Hansschlegelia quercus]|uniref:Invasion associated locus B family protein n=1 Tax=Hansschlegelia quercus TaxID=2528245 RepID=A0A4Q9GKZ5_9HYPH|nr:hypothetical protein [Hansschlegelia quercus]TBN54898.1 hypothetical protein EYR15_01685 [Hansschlegelia quercus]
MRLAIAAVIMLTPAFALAAPPASESDSIAIGPWQIEANYRAETFKSCVMSRTTEDGVEVRFVRDADGLLMTLHSPRWQLGKGKSYPVQLVAGSSTLDAEAAATANSVSTPIGDDKFLKSLGLADQLEIKGAGSTIVVALDRSAAGLERLETCFANNGSATESNPFVAPPKQP